jgi:membrane protein YdbS with pleckstrin-like domain
MAYKKENLGDGERMVLIAHKHVIVLLRAAFQWIALFIVAIVVAIILNAQPWTDFGATAKTVLLLVCLGAMVVSLIAFGISYLEWQAEQYIITNERVIQVEGIINKRELTTSIEKINDIETDQTLFGRILGYGTVDIITGSDTGINKLDYLDKPLEFKKVMLNAKNRHYGDASDYAPGGPSRRPSDGEDKPRRRVEVEQGYAAPAQPQQPYYNTPAQSYQNDPRGYAPRQQSQQPYYNNAPAQNYAPAPNGQPDNRQVFDAIERLARLRDSGAITEAEFQAKKNELMNRL